MARLLIIDDEQMICREFCDTLADLGHEADFALSGDEALRKIEGSNYQMIFLDLSMPRMSGAALFRRIRQYKRIPVAFMAGFMSQETEREVMDLGALRCLRKPVNLSDIVDLIDKSARFSPESN